MSFALSIKMFFFLKKHESNGNATFSASNFIFPLCMQPRDTCYVASAGLPDLMYSGYQPRAYSWDDFPPLKDILDTVSISIQWSFLFIFLL